MKKKLILLFIFISLSDTTVAQQSAQDNWAANYIVFSKDNGVLKAIDTLTMERIADADKEKVAARYESDLARWTISSSRDKNKDKTVVRRFLFDPSDDNDEYREFGWTDLHKVGKMNCIDGGHFFICQTTPNTEVRLNATETFLTSTGIFGIWLHYGVVELSKID